MDDFSDDDELITDLSYLESRLRDLHERTRKRFFRKPDMRAAALDYYELAKQFRDELCLIQSARCYQGAAKCENELHNYVREAENCLKAARLYLEQDDDGPTTSTKTAAPSVHERMESLQQALACYSRAVQIYLFFDERNPLAISTLLEMSRRLRHLGAPPDAVLYLEKAATLSAGSGRQHILVMRRLAEAQIEAGELAGALATYSSVERYVVGSGGGHGKGGGHSWRRDLARELVTKQILLLIVLEPPFDTLSDSQKAIQRYFKRSSEGENANGESSSIIDLLPPDIESDEVHLVLVSFIVSVEQQLFSEALGAAERLRAYLSGSDMRLIECTLDMLSSQMRKLAADSPSA